MNRSARRQLAVGGALVTAAVATALAGIAKVSADPAASAGGATPLGSTSAAPAPALRTGWQIPNEPTPAPVAAEWQSGRFVQVGRGDGKACTFVLLREWLKVECKDRIGGGLVAGDPKGVSIRTNADVPEPPWTTTVILPLRRGESKIVTFLTQNFEGYDSLTLSQAGMLSVVWRTGRAAPVLAMY